MFPFCEECMKRGEYTPANLVHHRIHLNESNINDPSITLNFENLEAVCTECHNKIHYGTEKRYKVDEQGNVIALDSNS